jgi:flavin-dependent dehydrogenase
VIRIKIDIVGGGFGGLCTAITIKRLDKTIQVTVHEKHNQIGYNPEGRRCAEGYNVYPALQEWGPPRNCIFNVIKKCEYIIGNTVHDLPINRFASSPMTIDRQGFLAHLGKKAEELGVDLQTRDKITSVSDLKGAYIVDASGCPSTIRKDLGRTQGRNAKSYQQTIENCNVFLADTVRFIFKNSMGYYWIFPRDPAKKEINLGVGILGNFTGNSKELLASFKKEWGIQGDVNYTTGGLIPVGLQKPLTYKNIIFVGDAGVGTFPITGEGVPRAILSGEIAGKCIVSGHVHHYPSLIKRQFLKWDIAGKTCLTAGNILQRIGRNAYETSLNSFFRLFFIPKYYKQ